MSTSKRAATPRRAPVQKRARATLGSILDAAARVFVEHGYAGGTTNRIAGEAGVSVGSLYEYFPNKDAILAALLERRIEEAALDLELVFAALEADRAASAEDAVRRVVDAMLARYRSAPELDRVLWEEVPHPPAARDALGRAERALAEAIERGVLGRPGVQTKRRDVASRLAARTLDALSRGYVFHGLHGLDDDAFKAELGALVGGYLGLRRGSARLGVGGAPAW